MKCKQTCICGELKERLNIGWSASCKCASVWPQQEAENRELLRSERVLQALHCSVASEKQAASEHGLVFQALVLGVVALRWQLCLGLRFPLFSLRASRNIFAQALRHAQTSLRERLDARLSLRGKVEHVNILVLRPGGRPIHASDRANRAPCSVPSTHTV